MRRSILTVAVLAFAATACSSVISDTSSTTAPVTVPTTTTTTVPSDEICKIGDLRFGTEGLVAALGEDVGDATTISTIRWEDSATCERVVVSFASDSGAPASSLGPTGVSVLAYAGIVRVVLPESLDTTAVADMLADGDLAHRIFVVRGDEGRIFIDIHSEPGHTIGARASTTSAPSTLIIDIIDVESDSTAAGAIVSPTSIVLTPTPGPTIYPFSVEGYAAPSLEEIRVEVLTEGNLVGNRSLALGGWTDAWQAYDTIVTDGPSGMVDIYVGTVGPEGEPDIGATVTIDLP
ncbi:MAG: hypothetical protein DWP92_11390 [Armatimonadetes bacterium]|nr:MAG: hypothetical protein DWP92_11390 [Armatimonadota bacterium]